MIEGSGDFDLQKITDLANKIYNTGFIPEEMYKSIFIAIPKKPGAVDCSLHRTISLMSQITKIIIKVILNRIKQKLKPEIAEEQYGFIEGNGTRNAIFIMRMLTERSIEVQIDICMCFIDYEKNIRQSQVSGSSQYFKEPQLRWKGHPPHHKSLLESASRSQHR